MLLRRVVDAIDDDFPAFFLVRPVRWRLALGPDGRPRGNGLLPLDSPDDTGTEGVRLPVPDSTRTSGVSPRVGADEVAYVLGWSDPDADANRTGKYHAAFVALVDAWAASAPEDADARAVRAFYTEYGPKTVAQPERWNSRQTVVITVGPRRVTDLPSLQAFWAEEVTRRKAGGKHKAGVRTGICLVCGRSSQLLDTLPQQLPQRLVPKAKQNAALVSANKAIHTYDFSPSLTTVPICIVCGRRAVANLQQLLEDEKRSATVGGGDSRLTWWSVGGDLDVDRIVVRAEAAAVATFLSRVHSGRPPATELDQARFCSLTLSGNQSRVVVRDWVDEPLARVEENVRDWFADHAIDVPYRDASRHVSLVRLELATGRWTPGRSDAHGQYALFNDRVAHRPEDVRRHLLRAALLGVPVPPILATHVLARIRADGHIDQPRTALLRLALVRRRPTDRKAPMPGLDPDNHDPYYLAGRIFAQLEDIQRASLDGGSVNTTYADRYLAGAIANPWNAMLQGRQLAAAWQKKTRRERPGLARLLESELEKTYSLLGADRSTLVRPSQTDQMMFVIGYEHQKLFRRPKPSEPEKGTTEQVTG